MPLYDRKCDRCGFRRNDNYEQSVSPDTSCPVAYEGSLETCCGTMKRIPTTSNPGRGGNVNGDECDVWMKHALCNDDATPRHFTSKAEIARVAKEKGYTNRVEHLGSKGSDKSRHTQRWF